MLSKKGKKRVCVVGAGVVGLSSAVCLLENLGSDACVTVVSDRPFETITSYGPVGIFRPALLGDRQRNRRWVKNSFDRLLHLWNTENPNDSGVQMVSGHIISDNREWLEDQEAYYSDVVFNFRWLSKEELAAFPVKHSYGVFFTTFTSEGQVYVPWLMNRFQQMGGHYTQRHVANLSELATEFDLVVNCSGLSNLINDVEMMTYRGALIQVNSPWMKHFLFAGVDDETYVLPGIKSVFLGTLREEKNVSLTLEADEKLDIMTRCCRICPSLRGCDILKEWVGLRPYRRIGVRLELEEVPVLSDDRTLPVIHNYGHGGNGFTSAHGCALEVASIAAERLAIPRSRL